VTRPVPRRGSPRRDIPGILPPRRDLRSTPGPPPLLPPSRPLPPRHVPSRPVCLRSLAAPCHAGCSAAAPGGNCRPAGKRRARPKRRAPAWQSRAAPGEAVSQPSAESPPRSSAALTGDRQWSARWSGGRSIPPSEVAQAAALAPSAGGGRGRAECRRRPGRRGTTSARRRVAGSVRARQPSREPEPVRPGGQAPLSSLRCRGVRRVV
jgi:hypothetical protein